AQHDPVFPVTWRDGSQGFVRMGAERRPPGAGSAAAPQIHLGARRPRGVKSIHSTGDAISTTGAGLSGCQDRASRAVIRYSPFRAFTRIAPRTEAPGFVN